MQERISCSLQPGQVLAKYLLAPVNPADINVLQGDTTRDHESCLLRFVMGMMVTFYTRSVGTYPIRPPLPATGGGEGVAEVVAVGPPGEREEQDQVNRGCNIFITDETLRWTPCLPGTG